MLTNIEYKSIVCVQVIRRLRSRFLPPGFTSHQLKICRNLNSTIAVAITDQISTFIVSISIYH